MPSPMPATPASVAARRPVCRSSTAWRTTSSRPIVVDVMSAFYLRLEVADEPGVLAAVAEVLAGAGVSVKSVVQKGLGDQARLVMVVHSVLESRFQAAMAEIARLPVLRAPPRAIRVLEEEFA